jgi:putative transposase
MPSTHAALYYHAVFSTKNRERWFDAEFQPKLHAYLGGSVNQLNAQSLIVGGVEDHVHLLCSMKTTENVADLIRQLKAVSSGWIKTELGRSAFAWQEGYGVFTVSVPDIEKVRKYIANQPKHHRNKSFQDEYLEMLQRAMVDFDPRFLW